MDCALLQGWEHNSSYDMTILYRESPNQEFTLQ